jgi:6-phosphogluconolactonase (cycloisomerase 2 family)
MMMNTDGANSRLINAANRLPSNPLLTSDNRYLFFIDEKEQESALWRYEMATGSFVQISPGFALTPALTRDNRFVIYASYNAARRLSLYRISIDGGAD